MYYQEDTPLGKWFNLIDVAAGLLIKRSRLWDEVLASGGEVAPQGIKRRWMDRNYAKDWIL